MKATKLFALVFLVLMLHSCQKDTDDLQYSHSESTTADDQEVSLRSGSSTCGYIPELCVHDPGGNALDPGDDYYRSYGTSPRHLFDRTANLDDYTTRSAHDHFDPIPPTIAAYKHFLSSAYAKTDHLGRQKLNLAIVSAVNACAASGDRSCPDTRCVINRILQSVQSRPSIAQEVYISYIRRILDLNDSETASLRKRSNVYGILSLSLVYENTECGKFAFCPGVEDQNQIVSLATKHMLADRGSWSTDRFYSKLEEHNYIDINDAIISFEQEYDINLSWSQKEYVRTYADACGNGVASAVVQHHLNRNYAIRRASEAFLRNHPNDPDAVAHRDKLVLEMIANPSYQEFVESTMGWSPIMWAIAKELIGDKAIDLLASIVGLKEIKEAIKAAKNNDWFSFTYETGKFLAGNTPLGKYLKLVDSTSKLYKFAAKIAKIWDKIDGYTEATITHIWNIAKKSPVRINANYWKYVDDLKTPKFGSYFATKNTYRTNFKNKFPEVKSEIKEVHHAIPQEIANRWKLVSQSDMHSFENLRGMPSRSFHQNITNEWNSFLKPYRDSGEVPPMNLIIAKAKEIDDVYGQNFIPPIR